MLYIEVFPLLPPKLTGVGRFAARMVQALSTMTPLRLTTFVDRRRAAVHRLPLAEGTEIRVAQGQLADCGDDLDVWVERLLRLPRQAFDSAAAPRSAVLYPWHRPRERRFGRELGVYHDFTPLIVPWLHEAAMRQAFLYEINAMRLCDAMLADSHSTRSDAAWLGPVPEENVVVAYPGPSQCVSRHAQPVRVPRRDNVLLVVGTREPRKNGDFLLDWFLQTDALTDDVELWWAGPQGWLWETPRTDRGHERWRRIKFLGMVSDARLCELYQQAACTLYPSLYEGFGFPVLDSLWHRTPVLCSYNSSLVEFQSPGVFYIDPYDPASLDAAYQAMRSAGRIEIDVECLADRFSWTAMARTVLSLAA